MLPFVLAMQLASAPPSAPAPAPSAGATAQPSGSHALDASNAPGEERDYASWMWRLELGAGTGGVAESNRLFRQAGYGSGQLWITTDVYGLVHPNVGIGGQMGMSRTVSSSGSPSPSRLNQLMYYGAIEAVLVPLRANRTIELQLIPRAGLGGGSVWYGTSVNEERPGGARFAPVVGAGAVLAFPRLQLSVGANYLYAPGLPTGDLERTHDFGGFYGTIGGNIDG